MSEHTTTEGLTEAEREALTTVLPASEWDYDPDRFRVEVVAVVERILADRLAAGVKDVKRWFDKAVDEQARAVAAEAERDAARAEVEALRERVENLPALTEGPLREGTGLWPECDRDAYSLAIEEAQTVLRAALDADHKGDA